MKKLFGLILAFAAVPLLAQQPQSQTAPISALNAKYTNGVAPGYYPTTGSGLTLNVGSGTAFCGGSIVVYSAGTLTMTASTTNYVYLNTASSCVPAVKTSAFASSDIPVAEVVTSGSAITSISDVRTLFVQPASGGSMVYPGAGVPCSTGTAWCASYALGNTGSDIPQLSGGLLAQSVLPLFVDLTFNSGAAATDAAPRWLASHTGIISACYVLTTASDGSTGLAFNIYDNGTSIFATSPTVSAGTSAGTLSTFSGLTSVPLTITNNDKLSINITSGTSSWIFTVQCK